MTSSTKALIAEFASAPTHPSPPPSLLLPWSSPLPQIPSPPLPLPSPPTHTSLTYVEAPLGYRVAKIRSRAASPLPVPSPPSLLPSTAHRDDIPEVDMPLQKRARFSTLAFRFEVGESSAAAARQAGHALIKSRAMTAIGEVNERVTDLSITQSVRAQVRTLQTQHDTIEWQRQQASDMVTTTFGRIHALEARDRARPDDLEDTDSSC
ncbi:hypothetical protein Tco_1117602 [Tanacetum coccineum]